MRTLYPGSAEGRSLVDSEAVVCDLLLAGWVFRKSKLWRTLNRDCRWLIYDCLMDHLPSSPTALVRSGFRPRLNYQRRVPRVSLERVLEHDFYAQQLSWPEWPLSFYLGAPPPDRNARQQRNYYAMQDQRTRGNATVNARDSSNRDSRGRIIHVNKGKSK